MDLEPSEQPHAERRRAATGDEPHKRRAVPVAAEDSEDEPHWLLNAQDADARRVLWRGDDGPGRDP
eukprot:2792770-Prymnesium_polylepis.1